MCILGNGGGGCWLCLIHRAIKTDRTTTIRVCHGTVPGDVPGLTTLVADLSSRVERTAVGRSAIPGDVALWLSDLNSRVLMLPTTYQFSACIALHSLCLAVTSVVIGTTALVACRWARTTNPACKASTKTTGKASTRRNDSTPCSESWSALKSATRA